jgi:hypothetical protein
MGSADDEDMGWLADQHAEEAQCEYEQRIEQRERQWDALAAFVKSEAQYAANKLMNRNECSDELRRTEFEKEARTAFMEIE